MELFEGMIQKEQDDLKRICNRLLSCCFLCKANENTRSDYYFVLRFKEQFRMCLGNLGYNLEINENYGVIQLLNPQNYNRLHLKLAESILLLILRVLYDEERRELSVSDKVIVTLGDIQDKYVSLNIRDKMIDKTTLRNSMALFRRMQLIEILDREMTHEDSRILIYDSILLAVRVEDVKQAYEKLENYRKGRVTDEEINEAETD